jgi:S-adenosylmethionine uptake transporter
MSRAPSIAIPFAVACIGIASFSAMDAVMKGLSIAMGAYNAMLWRTMAGALIGGLVFLVRRESLPARAALRLHLLRGTIASVMAVCFFWGIARVPLAEGIALSFIAPLITLYLAAVLLGETISRHAIIASLLGIAGVIVILSGRWGSDHGPEALAGIGSIFVSAIFYAYNLILQRQQAQVATPSEIAFFQPLVTMGVLGLAAPWLAVVPNGAAVPAIGGAALLAGFSLLTLSWAYARAEAQVLVAVEYTAFIWAALFGWLIFSEQVTLPVIAGAALIVTGCIIATRYKPAAQPEHVEAATL